MSRWSKRQRRAAQRVAEDVLSNEEIAAEAGVSRRQLQRWKLQPEFRDYVAELLEQDRIAISDEALKRSVRWYREIHASQNGRNSP